MNSNNARIRSLLEGKEKDKDSSLRGNALRRATARQVPTTLTPFEWEEWYQENGVPESHINVEISDKRTPWWRWW